MGSSGLRMFPELPGLQLVKFLDEPATDAQGFVAKNADTVVCSFRGTEVPSLWNADSWKDALADVDAGYPVEFSPLEHTFTPEEGPCTLDGEEIPYGRHRKMHPGFYRQFLSLKSQLDKYLIPLLKSGNFKHFYLCGHSLGGALAFACASYILDICE